MIEFAQIAIFHKQEKVLMKQELLSEICSWLDETGNLVFHVRHLK